MLKTYTWPHYAYQRPPELGQAAVRHVPVVVVGAGPVGLSAAIDAALRGLPVVLLDEDDTVSVGSRGVDAGFSAVEEKGRHACSPRSRRSALLENVGQVVVLPWQATQR